MASVNPLAGVASGTASTLGRTGSLTPSQPLPTQGAAHPTSPPTASHPLGSSAVAPGASHSIWSNRLMDLLNMVRHEFDVIGNDAVHFKTQRDEMEHRIAQQFNEINLIQDHVYELEKRHCDMVAQYEDEIRGLRHQLEVRGVTQPSDSHSYGSANRLASRTPAGNNSRNSSPGRSRTDRATSYADSHNPGTTRSGRDADSSWPPSKRAKTSEQSSSTSQADQRNARMKREERDLKRPGRWKQSDVESISTLDNANNEENSNDPLPESSKNSASSVHTDQNNPKTIQEDHSEQPIQPHKKEGADWVALYNPKAQPALDVDLVHTLVHDSVVCCVRFSPDGKYLATGCNRAANIFDTKTGKKTSVLQDPTQSSDGDLYIRSVCFSPDGKYLATGAEDHQIRIWDIAEQKLKTTLEGHKQEIYSLEYSQDGQILASGSGDKTVQIWDLENGKPLHVLYTSPGLNHGPGVTAIALSPDGRLVAAGALDTFVRVWDTKTGKLRCRLKGHKDSIYSVAFMPDGKTLVSGSLDKTLKLWNLSCIIESLDSMDDEISNPSMCISTLTGHKDYILSVSCSPEGQWIASGSKDRSVQFWDSRTGQSQLVLQGHKNSVIAINLSRSGNLLASGSGDFKYVQD